MVAGIQDRFELHGLPRIESGLVREDFTVLTHIAFSFAIVIPGVTQALLFGQVKEAVGIFPRGPEVIVYVRLHHLDQFFRKRSEAIHWDILGLGRDLPGLDEHEVNLLERLTGLIVGHIELAAIEILPQRY